MNPLVEQLLVVAIIVGALGFFARRVFRRKDKSCDAGCGCGAAKKPLPPARGR